ncbi:hypothetical protein [Deinococcus marmoris]|uniref:hypothetical protein n=1 Tax=Deinococcus marmoris TaxID=249408 RepID=UPI00049553F5|nr:hypothetical protein [Deinococcus marmoris]
MPFQPLDRDQPDVIMMCRNCQAEWLIYEQQIGLSMPCPACHRVVHPQYQGRTKGEGHGRQLSFSTFKRLLNTPDTSADFIRLVEHLLDLRHEGDLCFVDVSGHEVEAEEAHYRIQSQEASQGAMYNRAMNIIR